MSFKPQLVSAPAQDRSFEGVSFELTDTFINSSFTPNEREAMLRIVRLYKTAGLLGMPKFIHSSGTGAIQCSGILVPRISDKKNAFYLIKKADPAAASEYTLVMRGFEETGKLSERVETINFPRVVKDLRSFLYEKSPVPQHLSLVWNS